MTKCICPLPDARACVRERYQLAYPDSLVEGYDVEREDMCECECHSQDYDEPEDRLPPGC